MSYAATTAAVGLMWSQIQFMAATHGLVVYLITFAIIIMSGLGAILLYLIMKGDIGFRRVLIAQIRTMDQKEFTQLKDKYTSLVSEIATFVAHQKDLEPPYPPAPTDDSSESIRAYHDQISRDSMSHRNRQEAQFWDKFGARIIDLSISLKKSGVSENVVSRPIWSINVWPESYLSEVGAELSRLSAAYANEDEDPASR
ncbi:hypothetical protein PZ897_18395 [Hoeflea sp. YIM 152468]|uniref:hypothetical protein n=1 Tax=Hoeflea sp. YIM 152468 TaxID=3031759 RepID=UPI0023DB7107|nr:hypothetical protein [Hoeflea sp. YIM 152468]MDF1610157.1 hypothetical protein [Hoeflea sp. YIM 152468]